MSIESGPKPLSGDEVSLILNALRHFASETFIDSPKAMALYEVILRHPGFYANPNNERAIIPIFDLAPITFGRMSVAFDSKFSGIGTFYVGQDSRILLDGEPLNVGGSICSLTLRIERDMPVRFIIDAEARS